MNFLEKLNALIDQKENACINPRRRDLIKAAVKNKEVLVSQNGALATWTRIESTGRSPKDTLTARRPEIEVEIDWDSPNNLPLVPETFAMILEDALELAGKKDKKLYVTDRVVGADSRYALPVRTVSDHAKTALFTVTMFRPVPRDIGRSIYHDQPFTLLALPADKLDKQKYAGKLRKLPDGSTSDMVVAMDFVNRIGVVVGSAYMGSVKKLMFTVMNYLLPKAGILPLHASANEGRDGGIALFLGLSGTGKTTLSADPDRALLGDDEHGWDRHGIANFEFGCYAKLINLNPAKEPQIYHAITHEAPYLDHGAIVENAMMYPDGTFDFNDSRLIENSRGSYPLSFLPNIKKSSRGKHPKTIIFLTADANGVLPPVAKLDQDQAMFWFLMGYTSKLAGTETGIVEPVSTFSRFFGQPFMPRNPNDYASLLGEKIKKHRTQVYLVNTGWSGGPYGEGRRMDINVTRAIVKAVLNGELDKAAYAEDTTFHINIPASCPGVPDAILQPRNTWKDPEAFAKRAQRLAGEFNAHFDRVYGSKGLPEAVRRQCPGK
ncbi:MAG: phosphoenolpyruvate carboxykinase (ATP) [Candidatus Aminicenantes bacterium]|nr:phosphoenolpyruvate carboxykinase (ATP) [Candidatus Aminicenantes bacterium]